MSYKNAHEVLPPHLLMAVQQYIDGEYLYIPRRENEKRMWGSRTDTRNFLYLRNEEIWQKRLNGSSVAILAEEYFLSEKTIYKIINMKKKC